MHHVDGNGDPSPLILLANDQEWTLRSLETILVADGFRIERAYTGRQALDRARETLPDLAVLDLQLPDLSGLDVCRELQEDPTFGPGLPVILTTASSNGRSRQLEVFEAGAWDFFVQPLDGPLVLAKIRNFIAARRAFHRARYEGLTDPETRLYNLGGLTRRVSELGRGAVRQGHGLACVVVSPIDPALEAAAASIGSLARRVGDAIRRTVRGSDCVGRLRPLEFAIIAQSTDAEGALQIAERIEQALSATGSPVPLRVGISTMPAPAVTGGDPVDLLRRAKEALGPVVPASPAS